MTSKRLHQRMGDIRSMRPTSTAVRCHHRAGISVWGLGQTRLSFVWVVERYGFSLTTERMRRKIPMQLQACMVWFVFPSSYTILVLWQTVICDRALWSWVFVGEEYEQDHHFGSEKGWELIRVEEGLNLGTRRMTLGRSVLCGRSWPSIVT